MDDADRRTLIRHCVRQVFEPAFVDAFKIFLKEQETNLLYATTYFIQFGFPIATKPASLDIRPAAERLEEALVVALKDHD